MLIFLLAPLAVLAILLWLISISLRTGPAMHAPPKGAGAGQTGMANERR